MPSRRRALAGLALAGGAGLCLAIGLGAPSVEFNRFFFFTDRHSILSIIGALWREGEMFLFAVLALFSVVFPSLKIACLAAAGTAETVAGRRPHRLLGLSSALGRWSMLDVFVLALVVFYVGNTGLARAVTLPGIWFFAAAVILTMLSATVLARR